MSLKKVCTILQSKTLHRYEEMKEPISNLTQQNQGHPGQHQWHYQQLQMYLGEKNRLLLQSQTKKYEVFAK